MDPDANLEEQLLLSRKILAIDAQDGGSPALHQDTVRLAELVDALSEWIMGGGHLPLKWQSED